MRGWSRWESGQTLSVACLGLALLAGAHVLAASAAEATVAKATTAEAIAAETTAESLAAEAITADLAKRYVDSLADDTFEGRAAGTRGGRAAGLFIVKELERLKLPGVAEKGYYQRFDSGLANVLAVLEGSDPELKRQTILIGAHYDHVGYGNSRNSYGPTGYIHNGADDNASGVAGLLAIATAFTRLPAPPKRSVVFAFWDGEEAGLLGSKHWVDHPTIPLNRIAAMINIDMIGRLRSGRVEVYGVRTSRGFRRLVSEQNADVDLLLDFVLELKANSDHHSFYSHQVPTIFFHTGLHNDYHRPSDDSEKINAVGLRQTAMLIFKTAYELAERPQLRGFRATSTSESQYSLEAVEKATPPIVPGRMGISWDDHAEGLLVRGVNPLSPAARAGLRSGDRIVTAAGREIGSPTEFRALVLAAENPLWLAVRVDLSGQPTRIGLGWRVDDAEPEAVIVNKLVPGAPAALAGLRYGERIYRVNGETVASSDACWRLLTAADGTVTLDVESRGRIRSVQLTPLARIPSTPPEEASDAAASPKIAAPTP
jgi:hypothetical protein